MKGRERNSWGRSRDEVGKEARREDRRRKCKSGDEIPMKRKRRRRSRI